MTKEDFIKIVSNDLCYMLLGSVVSADSLVDKESCEKAMRVVDELEEGCNLLTLEDYTQEEINSFKKHITTARNIIQNELFYMNQKELKL